VLVRVRTHTGDSALLARVTRRSAQALALAPGLAVWAMVKSVALLD
jgi:molybdate transport system ATP-binding protein